MQTNPNIGQSRAYSGLMPIDPTEEKAAWEVWCNLMEMEFQTAREELAKIRGERGQERHLFYVKSCIEECSALLKRISVKTSKRLVLLDKSLCEPASNTPPNNERDVLSPKKPMIDGKRRELSRCGITLETRSSPVTDPCEQ